MEKINLLNQLKPKLYLRFALIVFLMLFAGKFIIKDALPYFGFDKEIFGHYWIVKWPLIGHISGGILALIIGLFQFSKAFLSKFMTTHRWLGRIYLTAILIATISATYMAWTTASFGNANVSFCMDCNCIHGFFVGDERAYSSTQGMDDTQLCGDFCFCQFSMAC
jgi:Predicted membrane protein (DUF2306)